MDLARRRLTPELTLLYFSGGGMDCVSYNISVYHFWLVCVCFPCGIPPLQSDWSLSCDHGLDYASCCENNNIVYMRDFVACGSEHAITVEDIICK